MKCTVGLLIAVVVIVGGLVPSTMAVDYVFVVSDGSWDNLLSRENPLGGHDVPGENDTATIGANEICRVDSGTAEVGTLIVSGDGELRIEGTDTLEVHAAFTVNTDGVLYIEDEGILELKGQMKRVR